MDDRNTIRRRIIDIAVDLFNEDNPNGGGLFTTAHYGQAMKAEFRISGPCPDAMICTGHLAEMDGIARLGGHMWRRLAQQEVPTQSDISETTKVESDDPHGVRLDVDPRLLKIEDAVEKGILRILAGGYIFAGGYALPVGQGGVAWTIETMADALKNNDLAQDGLLENMVGLALYTMAVDGRVISQPNILVDGARVTMFALAPRGADARRPPLDGSPDDGNFG